MLKPSPAPSFFFRVRPRDYKTNFPRRLAAILVSGIAPASARSGVLMPIRPEIIVPPTLRKWVADRKHMDGSNHVDRRPV